ncbi:MAG: bifunctional 2-C-methyl-D-erythritol 4-phosphate cytidylyltransferase/2-C-methyl-D-erythritol 2,4-cyclodiphosphate synthase [Alphaproteobacteria bacterium]|nr:bifunctional 2-C-methyl-D-erythritol 4-phosphate cytidylyltransferase/2-C-methyl-D-erythritol 2,4-cyclodiphosphate synthase [Alphaproteobacteria bacterium]
MGRVAILIVAGGRGLRAGGGIPKQYRDLAGYSLLRRTIAACLDAADLVQVVIGQGDEDAYARAVEGFALLSPAHGGPNRQESVCRGLEALEPHKPEFVLIHDGARPLVTPELIGRVIDALRGGADAVVPVLPVTDALKREGKPGVLEAVSRDGLYRAQTPQGFRFDAILRAHRAERGREAVDDIAIAETAGMKVMTVAGDERNMKVTSADDFAIAGRLLGAPLPRTGMGFDAHRFGPGDHVWLCGIRIAHSAGLIGHSDADAGLHALTDAILGALGAGDIGQHFPPTDERWRGASSDKFLIHARDLVRAAGGAIVHCDVTVICERPKLSPHREAMRARIAEILDLDMSRVSVKATTTEGMGFTGRQEGIAAQAVATIVLPS